MENMQSNKENIDTLNLIFNDLSVYYQAKKHFKNVSDFYPFQYNDEFKSISFAVAGQEDADSTEHYINQELQETDISGYRFESESSSIFSKGGSVYTTRKNYEQYLNEIGVPEDDKEENGGRVPTMYYNRYGEWLRKYDQIAFNVGYNNYTQGEFAKGGKVHEVRSTHEDDETIYIDVYYTEDENEEGIVVAEINKKTGDVVFRDGYEHMQKNSWVKEEINQALIDNDFSPMYEDGGKIDEGWQKASTIKFNTMKEAVKRRDLMKNRSEIYEYKNILIVPINYQDGLNRGYKLVFEYRPKNTFARGGNVGSVGMPLTIEYAEFITGTKGTIDLTKSRQEVALDYAKKYAESKNGRVTEKTKKYFDTSSDIFWEVRNLIEKIDTNDFDEVLKVFAYLYPKSHKDWQSALHMGLIYKAKSHEGNYADKPYIYNHPMAIQLREKGINFSNDLVAQIVNEYGDYTYAKGGFVSKASIFLFWSEKEQANPSRYNTLTFNQEVQQLIDDAKQSKMYNDYPDDKIKELAEEYNTKHKRYFILKKIAPKITFIGGSYKSRPLHIYVPKDDRADVLKDIRRLGYSASISDVVNRGFERIKNVIKLGSIYETDDASVARQLAYEILGAGFDSKWSGYPLEPETIKGKISQYLPKDVLKKQIDSSMYAHGGNVTEVSSDESFIIENGNDKTVKLNDGITYKIKASYANAIYPYKHTYADIAFYPVSKQSEKYKELKKQLGDEWLTDWKGMSDENRILVLNQLQKEEFSKGGGVKMPEKGTPEWHQLQIAKKTIKMTPVMATIMGGMDIDEAKKILDKYRIKYAKGGGIDENKRYAVYENCEALPDDYEPKYETNSYGLAVAYAKKRSKQNHPDMPADFPKDEYSDYQIITEIFDRELGEIVADFANGEPNYITPEPKSKINKKYLIVHKDGSKDVARFYSEKTGATQSLINVVKAHHPNADEQQIVNLIKLFKADSTTLNGKKILHEYLIGNKKDIIGSTNNALWMTYRLYYMMPVEGVEQKYVDYLKIDFEKGGGVDEDDKAIVTAVKWVKNNSSSGIHWNTNLVLVYDKNVNLTILTIDDEHNHLFSNWINWKHFEKAKFKNGYKYNKTKIREEIIDLIKENKLESLQRDDVKSSILKYLRMSDKYELGGEVSPIDENDVFNAYVSAALWSSYDDDGNPLDEKYSASDIAPKTIRAMKQDVQDFIEKNKDVIIESELTSENLGHTFWLSRNHHGSGFFDYALPDDVEKKLTDYSNKVKGIDLYVGDDGMIHHMSSYADGGKIKNEKYCNIVFLQGSEAEEPLRIYDEEGVEDAIKYLSQWDYGTEMEYDLKDEIGAGTSDKTFRKGNYILTVNTRLGYIGLERAVVENENEKYTVRANKKRGQEGVVITSGATLKDVIDEANKAQKNSQYFSVWIVSPEGVLAHTDKGTWKDISKRADSFYDFEKKLIEEIKKDGTQENEIVLNHKEIHEYYASGHTPKHVYENIWEKDAGNFYKIDFAIGGKVYDNANVKEAAKRQLQKLNETGQLVRYYDVRGDGKKYFEIIVKDKKEKGNYKRYESLQKGNLGTLQNAYLTEDEVFRFLYKSIEKMKNFELGGEVDDDPTKEQMIEHLQSEMGGFEAYDNFAAEEAIYWYANDNHSGQSSNLYSALSTSTYKPSPSIKGIEDVDDEISIAMYNTLVEKFGGEEIETYSEENEEDSYEFAKGGEITPAINQKIYNYTLQKLKTKGDNVSKEEFDRTFNEVIVEFGYDPIEYHKTMSEIGAEQDGDDGDNGYDEHDDENDD